jgi:hypothetical protein
MIPGLPPEPSPGTPGGAGYIPPGLPGSPEYIPPGLPGSPEYIPPGLPGSPEYHALEIQRRGRLAPGQARLPSRYGRMAVVAFVIVFVAVLVWIIFVGFNVIGSQ